MPSPTIQGLFTGIKLSKLLDFLHTFYTLNYYYCAIMPFVQYDLGTRIQALTLLEVATGIPRITELTGMSKSTIYDIRKKAIEQGYNPQVSTKLLLSYVEDAPRSGRPKKATEEVEDLVIKTVTKNSTTRQ